MGLPTDRFLGLSEHAMQPLACVWTNLEQQAAPWNLSFSKLLLIGSWHSSSYMLKAHFEAVL